MKVFDLFKRRVLVTRDSAHLIEPALVGLPRVGPGPILLDFAGIEAITPSFVDELLGVLESNLSDSGSFEVTFKNFPANLSAKYEAIARGRAVSITVPLRGQWIITKVAQVR